LADKVKAGIAVDVTQAVAEADLIFLTVPDDLVGGFAKEISRTTEPLKEKFFFHTSGVLEAEVLRPIREKGGIIGSIHPLQTFADRDHGWKALPGSWFALDGDEAARQRGEELVQALCGKAFILPPGRKPLYHAAACIAANFLVTLEYISSRLLGLCGVPEESFYSVAGPLIEQAVKNIKNKGVPYALTGPVTRGDLGTVSLHLDRLQDWAPEYVEFYRVMLQHTLELAGEYGYIGEEQVNKFRAALSTEEDDGKR
jgi:predicted short-subunit dehydrogenase-like oxidoreductase (DUF2520 family)